MKIEEAVASEIKRAPEPQEQNEIKGDQWTFSLPKTRIHTLDELLAFFHVDTAIWEVERFIANKWEVGAKNAKDALVVEPLYQVKAFFRRKRNIVAAKKEIEELKELAKQSAPVPVARACTKPSGNMLEIDISDHHFGKLAWGVETGHQNYDTKIAARIFHTAVETLLARSAAYRYGRHFDEIWFVIGNDLLNSDDAEHRTTKGTFVDTDARYQKTFAAVRTVMIQEIERLRKYTAKVKVIMVSGNHDQMSVWHLGDSLECYFHKYKDVEVDNLPRYRKYHQFGQTLIMYTHGDKGKRNDYPLLMATEQSALFGSTKFHEVHTGHTHGLKVDEQHGVRVRVLSSLSPPDAWHAENAYVGNLRSAEGFIWNRTEGLIGTVIYTDQETGD